MIQYINKIIATIIIFYSCSLPAAAQVPSSSAMSGTQVFLLTIAIILLIPIYIMGRAFMASVKMYHEKRKEKQTSAGGSLPVILMLISLSFFSVTGAQDATSIVETVAPPKPVDWGTVILFITIVTELLVILYLSAASLRFIKGNSEQDILSPETLANQQPALLNRLWMKVNKIKLVNDEEALDTGHNYDGIRELDNNIPAWFTAAFVISIIFSVAYFMRYHVFHSAPLQIEEYTLAMAEAEQEHAAYLEKNANAIDENNVQMLDADNIASGKILFSKNCAVCHLEDGGGNTGPNLADTYWLHGGSVSDIFKSIKYGWPEKGMIPWKDNFSAKQLAQITSFVKSLQGTKPAISKEPQGEIYVEETKPVADSAMGTPPDSLNTAAKDTTSLASK